MWYHLDRRPAILERRALLSGGTSNDAIYRMIAAVLESNHRRRGVILDVGCGGGALRAFVAPLFNRYAGTDLLRYEGSPRVRVSSR